jgi:hypothetical protein
LKLVFHWSLLTVHCSLFTGHRSLLTAHCEAVAVLHDLSECAKLFGEQLQSEVLEALGSVATEARDEIIRRLTEKNALRSALDLN